MEINKPKIESIEWERLQKDSMGKHAGYIEHIPYVDKYMAVLIQYNMTPEKVETVICDDEKEAERKIMRWVYGDTEE